MEISDKLSGKDIKLSLVLFVILVFLPCTCCKTDNTPIRTTTPYTGPPIQYSIFELEATDIRLKYFQHQLYRLEYPSIFNLIDMNLADTPHIYGDMTVVDFTVQQIDIPKSKLSIIVEESMEGYYLDAAGKRDYFFHPVLSSVSETEVFGIPAYYLESHYVFSEYQVLSRSAFFDYECLIWEIRISWCYHDSVGPEVEEYFNHIIETFEILK